MITAVRITTPPVEGPVSLAEAKLHLRVDLDAEDDLVAALLDAAQGLAGDASGLAWVDTDYEVVLDGLPIDGVFRLPRGPIQAVDSITYRDADGVSIELGSSTYRAVLGTNLIVRAEGADWPTTSSRPDAVTVAYTAGFGASAAAVPARAKAAVKLLLGHLYEHRGDDLRSSEFPPAVQALLASIGGHRYG